jgi:hypothetical protein
MDVRKGIAPARKDAGYSAIAEDCPTVASSGHSPGNLCICFNFLLHATN